MLTQLMRSASEASTPIMSYKTKKSPAPCVPRLLDIALWLSDNAVCEPGAIFSLIEHLVEGSTISNCQDVFSWIERETEVLRKDRSVLSQPMGPFSCPGCSACAQKGQVSSVSTNGTLLLSGVQCMCSGRTGQFCLNQWGPSPVPGAVHVLRKDRSVLSQPMGPFSCLGCSACAQEGQVSSVSTNGALLLSGVQCMCSGGTI